MVLEARSSGCGDTTLAEIVMKSCEESLFPHLWEEQVVPLLSQLVDPKEEQDLVEKMSSQLEGLPQSFFEIPKGCESPSRWSAAALEMAGVASAVMPTDKLAALLRAAKGKHLTVFFAQGNPTHSTFFIFFIFSLTS